MIDKLDLFGMATLEHIDMSIVILYIYKTSRLRKYIDTLFFIICRVSVI